MYNLVWKDLLLLKRSLWLASLYVFFAFFVFRTMQGGALSAATVGATYMLMAQAITLDDKNKSEIMLSRGLATNPSGLADRQLFVSLWFDFDGNFG